MRPAEADVSVELRAVTKTYRARGTDVRAVQPTDLGIRSGEFFSLLGPSGCGKSTMLRMIAGFEEPTGGQIFLAGSDVTRVAPNRRDINLVFQNYALFPNLDVFDNVAFGLRRKGVDKTEIRRRVAEVLELVSLVGFERRSPREMSGGQQQRVAVARALVNRPSVLLLDEPLGALDLKLRQSMQIELKRIQREVGITFLYVTHDQGEALAMSDRIAVMNNGVIEQVAAPQEIYDHPATRFVADFIGVSNLISARVASVDGSTVQLDGHAGDRLVVHHGSSSPEVGSTLTFAIRPERITIGPAGSGTAECQVSARVAEVTYQGTSINYTMRTQNGEQVVAFAPVRGTRLWTRDDDVLLSWQADDVVVLAGGR